MTSTLLAFWSQSDMARFTYLLSLVLTVWWIVRLKYEQRVWSPMRAQMKASFPKRSLLLVVVDTVIMFICLWGIGVYVADLYLGWTPTLIEITTFLRWVFPPMLLWWPFRIWLTANMARKMLTPGESRG